MSDEAEIIYPKIGERFKPDPKITKTIEARCSGESGMWMCLSHNLVLQGKEDHEKHVRTGRHKMAFICTEHGYETPSKENL